MLAVILASAILALAPEARDATRLPIDPLESVPAASPLAAASKGPIAPILTSLANVRVNDPSQLPGPAADITPAIAVNGNQVLVVWRVIGPTVTQRLRAAWSEDGGNTFTDAGWLPNFAGWRWGVDPNVDVDPSDGTFLVSAQVSDPALPATGIGIVTAHIAGGLTWGPVSVTNPTGYLGVLWGNTLHATFDATNFTWHLAFDDFYTSKNALIHRNSADHGATWFAPDTVVQDVAGRVGGAPRIGWLPDRGPIIAHWNLPVGAWDTNALKSSAFVWPSFNAPVPVSTYRNDVASLPGTRDGVASSTLAVDRTPHVFSGRAYVAWVESATPSTPAPGFNTFSDVEPNDTPATANPVGTLSGYIDGQMQSSADADVYSVSLAAGEHLVLSPVIIQSIGVSTNVRSEILAPDGVHTLGMSGFLPGDVSVGRTLFTAPRAGTYYVRITGFQVAGYTFALTRSTQAAAPARDRRELMTSHSDDFGASWSSPVPIPMGGPGFEVGNLAMVIANDGRPYLFWQDYSKSDPDGVSATIEVSRSSDGGQTWETSRTISSVASDWNPVPITAGSNMKMGYRMDAATTPIALLSAAQTGSGVQGALTPSDMVHVVWPDARGGIESDIESAHFPTGFETVFALSDTNVVPGQTVQLRMVVHNKNSLFTEQVTPMGFYLSRNWSHGYINPFTIDASSTVVVYPFSVTVPDTAAPGSVLYLGGLQGAGGEFIAAMSPSLHVQSTTAVTAEGPLALAFDPPAPNPVRQLAALQFTLPSPSRVALEVFDVTGARLRTLESGTVPAGRSSRAWDLRDDRGRGVAPGVYLARLTVGNWSRTRRLVVTR